MRDLRNGPAGVTHNVYAMRRELQKIAAGVFLASLLAGALCFLA